MDFSFLRKAKKKKFSHDALGIQGRSHGRVYHPLEDVLFPCGDGTHRHLANMISLHPPQYEEVVDEKQGAGDEHAPPRDADRDFGLGGPRAGLREVEADQRREEAGGRV
jgi:hypothetical protein